MKNKKCKSTTKKKIPARLIATFLLIVILAVAILIGLLFFNVINADSEAQISDILSGESLNLTVKNEEDALNALDSMGFYYGYENAEDVFEADYTRKTSSFTVYSFNQVYEGLPVTGHTMRVIAGDDGTVFNLVSNYVNIAKLSVEPKITEQKAANIAGINEEDYSAELCVYISEDTAYLAWDLRCGYTEYYVNANTGKIIHESNLWSDYDQDKWISMDSLILYGQNEEDGLLTVSGQYVSDEDRYYLIDSARNIKTYSFYTWDNANLTDANLVSFGAAETANSSAVDAVYNISRVYDFYEDVLGLTSLDGKGKTEIDIVVDMGEVDGEQKRDNAVTGTNVEDNQAVIAFFISEDGYDNSYYLEVAAHEYAHAVQKFIIKSDEYATEEGKAIDEGIADILAELCSAYYNEGEMDWFHTSSSGGRDMKNPSGVQLSNYSDYDSTEKHAASTILSHAAYIMYAQPDLGSEYAIDDYVTLASLWYEAIYYLNEDSDYADCRDAVECAAEVLVNEGKLTEAQYVGVVYAFEQSGIEETVKWYIADEDTDIEVLVTDYNNNRKIVYPYYTASICSIDTDLKAYKVEAEPEDGKISISDLVSEDSAKHIYYYLTLEDEYTDRTVEARIYYRPHAEEQGAYVKGQNGPVVLMGLTSASTMLIPTNFGSRSWIYGTVVDEEGEALSGVEVSLQNWDNLGQTASVRTDDAGYYKLFLYYEAGDFTLTFTKYGCQDTELENNLLFDIAKQTLAIEKLAEPIKEYQYIWQLVTSITKYKYTWKQDTVTMMYDYGSLSGTVYESENTSTLISGASVTAVRLDEEGNKTEKTYSEVTGTDGSYKMKLPVGEYALGFSADGYFSEERNIVISIFEDEVTTKDGVMKRPSMLEGALEWNGHYYYIYDNVCSSWEEAKEYCESLGGYLAVISSEEENTVLYEYMLSCGYRTAYFGYSDSVTEGEWEWVPDESSSYTNWGKNEPNSERENEDYAEFYYKNTESFWNDGNFKNGTVGDSRVFICEWNLE